MAVADNEGANVTVDQVLTAGRLTSGTSFDRGDINLTCTKNAGDDGVDMVANSVDGIPVSGVTDTWDLPQF